MVGGAVRSLALGGTPPDYDFATNAHPDQVQRVFRRVIPTGIEHGTVTVLYQNEAFEVTTYRTEGAYSDARHPDEVAFVGSISEDLKRRDFTMNALAIDPADGTFLDPHEGLADLTAGLIRAIGSPSERFGEDALRVMRAIRFAAQLGFEIEPHTLEAMSNSADLLSSVSIERIRDELSKLLVSSRPSHGLKLAAACGAQAHFLPELSATIGFEQGGRHHYPLFEHLLLCCDAIENKLELRLAALLHDVGKPESVVRHDDEIVHFHDHDELGARLVREALTRLRFPRRTIEHVSHLVRHHMFGYTVEWSDAAVRRFIARVGRENIDDLLALRVADSFAVTGERPHTSNVVELRKRIDRVLTEQNALTVRDLAVNGNDLQEAGVPRGPLLGVILRQLLETVLDDPQQNTPETLIPMARKIYTRIRE